MWGNYSLMDLSVYNDGSNNNKSWKQTTSSGDMVQRQRIDPIGTRGRVTTVEPDETLITVKSERYKVPSSDVVVEAIDSRHVVDEIRDNSPTDDGQREGNNAMASVTDLTATKAAQLNIPRASWFDVFDWNGISSAEKVVPNDKSTTMVVVGEVLPEPLLVPMNNTNECYEKETPKSLNLDVEGTKFVRDKIMSTRSNGTAIIKEQTYPQDNTENSIVATNEVQTMRSVRGTNAEVAEIQMTDQSENKEKRNVQSEDLSLCALVMDDAVIESDPTTKRPSEITNDGACHACLCFPRENDMRDEVKVNDNVVDNVEAQANTKSNNHKDFLSTIFACIDPSPTIKDDSDLLADIEKSLTAELAKEDKVEKNVFSIDPPVISIDPVDINDTAAPVSTSKTIVVNPLTPLSSNMIFNHEPEDSSADGNLLDKDLESVPSVKEEVEDSVLPLEAKDLGSPKTISANSATIVERNAIEVKVPINHRDEDSMVSNGTGKSSMMKIDPSIDARRSLLIKELRSAISTFGRYDVRCANISAALGDLMDEAKDYDHAIKLHKDAGTIYSCKLGDDHETTLGAKMRLGAILENAGRVEEAINCYYQVTVMQRALHGDQDPSVAESLVRMAHALRTKGDYQPAIKELKRALKIYRETLGDSDEKVAATVDEIASLYVTIGDFNKSAAILEEVVKLKAATMGMKSKSVAGTLGNLATAYECSEKFEEAMKALKKSYKIYTETGGYSSEDATLTLNRMAQLYEAMKDPNRAAVAYLGVLRGRKIQRGADHLSVGETYFRLGHALRETKQYDKALKCLKEALPIFVGQGVEMNDVKMVAEIMHEMAMINKDRSHYQDAVRIFKQELSVLRKIGQPEYPFAARTLKQLGITEYQLKNYSRSLKHFVEALSIYQKHNDQGLECADVLVHTGLVFQKIDNKERAFDAYNEAIRIYGEHKVSNESALLKEAKENMAVLEQSRGKK